MIAQLKRELGFLLGQKNLMILLGLCLLLSSFAIYSGHQEIVSQHLTIERLEAAQQQDIDDVVAKHDTLGSLGYYQFHLTYQAPSSLAFAALGERDLYPWKHRIRALALEGQIYESDTANPELAYVGKFDFSFLISVLAPLLVILLLHDVIATERTSGRFELLTVTAKGPLVIFGYRIVVRYLALCLCLLVPFYLGATVNGVAAIDVLLSPFWYWSIWPFGSRSPSGLDGALCLLRVLRQHSSPFGLPLPALFPSAEIYSSSTASRYQREAIFYLPSAKS